jgi:hypothetical protein
MQRAGFIGGKPLERDPGEDRTKANPDHWRDRAEEARARAGVLRDRNIRTALLSIAEGFERLGVRAHDTRRSEPPTVTPPPADVSASGGTDRLHASVADTNLAETFRVMETLAPKPLSPATAAPDRVERVARALCQADGRDPDRAIETGQWETIESGGLQTRRPVTLRGWKAYEKNAKQFLAALDAALDR